MAMLKAGRALVLLHGYIPDDGSQHKTVVEITRAILGKQYNDIIEQFETMRRKRHQMTYEAGTLLSKSEAQKALSSANDLINKIIKVAEDLNSQLELKLDE